MTALDQHFLDIGACTSGREWIAANCQTAAQAWELLLAKKRVDWAMWWLATDGGWSAVEPLLRRWVLRILRKGAPALVDVATAERLRAIADTATWDELRDGLRALALALDRAHAFARDIANALASDLDLNLDLALDHAHAIARDIAHALALARASVLDRALASASARVRVRASAVDKQVADLRELCKCPWSEGNKEQS